MAREIEPIGLFYYHWHWHLIAWCRLRQAYRDFRLDRVSAFSVLDQRFATHDRLTLSEYLKEKPDAGELVEVEVLFSERAKIFVQEQRYQFGFVEQREMDEGVYMRFLTHVPEYMARWLLQYTNEVSVISGDEIREELKTLSEQLANHWL